MIERFTHYETIVEEEINDETPDATSTRAISAPPRKFVPVLVAGGALLIIGLASWAFWRKNAEPPTNALQIRSLAVLPFRQIGEARKDDEYLSIGLADALTTRLSYLREVKVRPTSAIAKFDGKDFDSIAVGHELGVDAVLEGTIRREGENVRVSAQLVRVADGSVLWAESLNEHQSNLLSLENVFAARAASLLSSRLNEAETKRLNQRPTQNSEAYQAYLKGQFFFIRRVEYEKAEGNFKQAIALDPNFALPYVGLASIYAFAAPESARGKEAEPTVRKAVELDPNSAEARSVLAFILSLHQWQWNESEAEFKRAIELNQNYAQARQWYATNLSIRRRFTEAEFELRKALEIDPLSLPVNADLCEVFYFSKRYDEAIGQCRKTLDLDNGFFMARFSLTKSYFQKQMYVEAADFYLSTEPNRKTFEQYGWNGSVERHVEALKNKTYVDNEAYGLSYHYAVLGDRENALRWLERAGQMRHFMLPFANVEPAFEFIRDDSRFADIIHKMNLDS